MEERSLVELINLLFNISHLILLLLILSHLNREKTRSDRLEERNKELTERFIRFVLLLPPSVRVTIPDLESDDFVRKYPPGGSPTISFSDDPPIKDAPPG